MTLVGDHVQVEPAVVDVFQMDEDILFELYCELPTVPYDRDGLAMYLSLTCELLATAQIMAYEEVDTEKPNTQWAPEV